MREQLVATGKITGEDIELATGAIGAFEISIDGETKYSKLATGRFPSDAEVGSLI